MYIFIHMYLAQFLLNLILKRIFGFNQAYLEINSIGCQ